MLFADLSDEGVFADVANILTFVASGRTNPDRQHPDWNA